MMNADHGATVGSISRQSLAAPSSRSATPPPLAHKTSAAAGKLHPSGSSSSSLVRLSGPSATLPPAASSNWPSASGRLSQPGGQVSPTVEQAPGGGPAASAGTCPTLARALGGGAAAAALGPQHRHSSASDLSACSFRAASPWYLQPAGHSAHHPHHSHHHHHSWGSSASAGNLGARPGACPAPPPASPFAQHVQLAGLQQQQPPSPLGLCATPPSPPHAGAEEHHHREEEEERRHLLAALPVPPPPRSRSPSPRPGTPAPPPPPPALHTTSSTRSVASVSGGGPSWAGPPTRPDTPRVVPEAVLQAIQMQRKLMHQDLKARCVRGQGPGGPVKARCTTGRPIQVRQAAFPRAPCRAAADPLPIQPPALTATVQERVRPHGGGAARERRSASCVTLRRLRAAPRSYACVRNGAGRGRAAWPRCRSSSSRSSSSPSVQLLGAAPWPSWAGACPRPWGCLAPPLPPPWRSPSPAALSQPRRRAWRAPTEVRAARRSATARPCCSRSGGRPEPRSVRRRSRRRSRPPSRRGPPRGGGEAGRACRRPRRGAVRGRRRRARWGWVALAAAR